MALQYSTTLRNARLDAIETIAGTSPILEIRTGSVPSDCAQARTGTVLATVTLPSDWMAAASGGSKAMSGSWVDSAADNTGTAGYFTLYKSDGTTVVMQGTVGMSGADLIVQNTSFVAGQRFEVTAFTITDGSG